MSLHSEATHSPTVTGALLHSEATHSLTGTSASLHSEATHFRTGLGASRRTVGLDSVRRFIMNRRTLSLHIEATQSLLEVGKT